MVIGGVHTTKNYKRYRKISPKKCDPKSFRIKDVGRKGFTKIVVCCKKGDYDKKTKRCRTGLVTQSILKAR